MTQGPSPAAIFPQATSHSRTATFVLWHATVRGDWAVQISAPHPKRTSIHEGKGLALESVTLVFGHDWTIRFRDQLSTILHTVHNIYIIYIYIVQGFSSSPSILQVAPELPRFMDLSCAHHRLRRSSEAMRTGEKKWHIWVCYNNILNGYFTTEKEKH